MSNNKFAEYKRIMCCIEVDESVKRQIIQNCAKYSTFVKIKTGKNRLIAIKKESGIEKL